MTTLAETSRFRERLSLVFGAFAERESQIRGQYAGADGLVSEGRDLLERATRRFLIDGFLQAAGWSPDEPDAVVEEGRAWSAGGDRLYFDYVGLKPATREPVVIVEAKGLDVQLPHAARQPVPGPDDMAALVARALHALKTGKGEVGVVAEWSGYLRDLRDYVGSLDDLGKRALSRVVITGGTWMIAFEEPVKAFLGTALPETSKIRCYIGVNHILTHHEEIHALLARARLVDTLPLLLDYQEAIRMLPVGAVTAVFRGLLVVTSGEMGALRARYPLRTLYPVVIAAAGGGTFAVFDPRKRVIETEDRLAPKLLTALESMGTALAAALARDLEFALPFGSIAVFPGFPTNTALPEPAPVQGSAAARLANEAVEGRRLATRSEPSAGMEFIVVTGEDWFHKQEVQRGAECDYHFWLATRSGIGADPGPKVDRTVDAFTVDSDCQHCAHGSFRQRRSARCHVAPFEVHLCCRTCVFEKECWSGASPDPCPQLAEKAAVLTR